MGTRLSSKQLRKVADKISVRPPNQFTTPIPDYLRLDARWAFAEALREIAREQEDK